MSDLPSSISFPTDDRGHLGRECPEESCNQRFNVKLSENKIPAVNFCPTCGTEESADKFWTQEQVKKIESTMRLGAENMFGNMLEDSFKSSSILSVKKGSRTKISDYTENILGKIHQCRHCEAEFSMETNPQFCCLCGKKQ